MAAKVKHIERKPDKFKMFPYVDNDDGSFNLPNKDDNEKFLFVEALIEQDKVDDYYQGMFFAITELLSTPAALQFERAKELIGDIIDESVEEDDEEEDETPPPKNKKGNKMKEEPDYTDEEMLALLDEKESAIMTEQELDDWYYSEKDLQIPAWMNMVQEEKYKKYLYFMGGRAADELPEPPEQSD